MKRARDFAPSYARKMRKVARYVRRKYRRRGAKTSYMTGQRGNAIGGMYRTRMLPYKQYKRKLYRSLAFKESYRSIFSEAGSRTFTTALDRKIWYVQTLLDNFMLPAGGLTGASDTFTWSKLIIKGGMISVSLHNTLTVPIVVEWGIMRYINNLQDIYAVESEHIADISCIPGYGNSFRLISRMKSVTVEPGDRIEMRCRVPFKVINNYTQWTTERQGKTALVYSIQDNTAAATTLPIVYGHNLTFCGDAITA